MSKVLHGNSVGGVRLKNMYRNIEPAVRFMLTIN